MYVHVVHYMYAVINDVRACCRSERWWRWLGMLYLRLLAYLGRIPDIDELQKIMEGSTQTMREL